jgi:hypothetical protein
MVRRGKAAAQIMFISLQFQSPRIGFWTRAKSGRTHRNIPAGFLLRVHNLSVVDHDGVSSRALAQVPADRFGEFCLGVGEEEL